MTDTPFRDLAGAPWPPEVQEAARSVLEPDGRRYVGAARVRATADLIAAVERVVAGPVAFEPASLVPPDPHGVGGTGGTPARELEARMDRVAADAREMRRAMTS